MADPWTPFGEIVELNRWRNASQVLGVEVFDGERCEKGFFEDGRNFESE